MTLIPKSAVLAELERRIYAFSRVNASREEDALTSFRDWLHSQPAVVAGDVGELVAEVRESGKQPFNSRFVNLLANTLEAVARERDEARAELNCHKCGNAKECGACLAEKCL